MKLGILARRLAETLEQVRLIRALGFDSIWAGEHHATPGFHFFPQMAFLQRVAAEAEGLWVGTNVALLPLHNPVELAEIGAFMDENKGKWQPRSAAEWCTRGAVFVKARLYDRALGDFDDALAAVAGRHHAHHQQSADHG